MDGTWNPANVSPQAPGYYMQAGPARPQMSSVHRQIDGLVRDKRSLAAYLQRNWPEFSELDEKSQESVIQRGQYLSDLIWSENHQRYAAAGMQLSPDQVYQEVLKHLKSTSSAGPTGIPGR
ncbi:hypothetical protein H1R20_g11226, partial [Candolleomyces eurysporus]